MLPQQQTEQSKHSKFEEIWTIAKSFHLTSSEKKTEILGCNILCSNGCGTACKCFLFGGKKNKNTFFYVNVLFLAVKELRLFTPDIQIVQFTEDPYLDNCLDMNYLILLIKFSMSFNFFARFFFFYSGGFFPVL